MVSVEGPSPSSGWCRSVDCGTFSFQLTVYFDTEDEPEWLRLPVEDADDLHQDCGSFIRVSAKPRLRSTALSLRFPRREERTGA